MSLYYDDESDEETYPFPENRPEIRALSLEKCNDRYSVRNDQFGPDIAEWRSNLAASSQRRNLLFVAYGTDIHVWAPSGPFQKLGSQPQMIIKPLMKNPGARGYIDRNAPHSINNILVDDLGRDEVLLLATDSGNICAYHVESIFTAISLCASRNDKRPFAGSEVTPFLMEDVGQSAWGLAMHKYARLIAVSSNTSHITVFALALANPTSENDSDNTQHPADQQSENLDDNWVKIDNRIDLQLLRQSPTGKCDRSRNLRITYKGHLDNIPCVSFANFDLDPNGEWMVSTDITNRVMIWRLWDNVSPHRIYYPGHPLNNPPGRPQRGWSVIPLDPRTFKRQGTKEEACGCDPEVQVVEGRILLDISRGVEDLYDASQVFHNNTNQDDGDGDVDENEDGYEEYLDDDGEEEDDDEYYDDRDSLPNRIFSTPLLSTSGRYGSIGNSEHRRGAGQVRGPGNPIEYGKVTMSEMHDAGKFQDKSPVSALVDEENPHYRVDNRLEYQPLRSEQRTEDFNYVKTHPVHPLSPSFFPVIHFSESNITLAPYPLDSEYQLVCESSLLQRVFLDVDISFNCDRFNMVKYIPELGLVVAGSQKGRVAIISLCWQEEVGFTFRLDWIVPFSTQECRHERPIRPLLGVAVSPMPGFENPPDAPYIPQGVDLNDQLAFNYRTLEPDSVGEEGSTLSPSLHSHTQPSHRSPSDRPQPSNHSPTPAEMHAQASASFRPHERWHGWHPSRHYRLMLLFNDHSVMNYEFWHDWKA